ncbi:MAG: A/G-specific adenine glycosylase [Thermoanaerobaculia bacterium]
MTALSASDRSSTDRFESTPRAERLLEWFDRVKRPLPWRKDRDPYRVWISEIMLQQTRVETVLPYYESFLRSFPTVQALAAASDDEVRSLWSGLGYYRRAIMLRDAARRVNESGAFPSCLDGWLDLPGVGRYTAAAVMSIVHGARVAALDGNLERVLSRIEAFEGDPKSAAGRRHLVTAARPWLDATRPGDSNQALMELGTTLCRPKRPVCGQCPIVAHCRAHELGRENELPVRRSRRRPVERQLIAVVVQEGGRFLLFRRDPDVSLLGDTWELPWVEANGSSPTRSLNARYGGRWTLGPSHGLVRHSITHRRLSVTVRSGNFEPPDEVTEGRPARWADLAGLGAIAHSSLVRKAARLALAAVGRTS